MSIYPVKLIEWFPHPRKRRYGTHQEAASQHEICRFLVKMAKCLACGKQATWSRAWGHHSIPWGSGDIWCSEKCLDSRKRYSKLPRQKKVRGHKKKEISRILDEVFPNAKQNKN